MSRSIAAQVTDLPTYQILSGVHSISHNLAVIGVNYDAFGRPDIPIILGHLADDVRWEEWSDNTAQKAGVPWLQARHGKAGALEFFQVMGSRLQVTEFRVLSLMAGGNQVAAEFVIACDVKGTGRRYRERGDPPVDAQRRWQGHPAAALHRHRQADRGGARLMRRRPQCTAQSHESRLISLKLEELKTRGIAVLTRPLPCGHDDRPAVATPGGGAAFAFVVPPSQETPSIPQNWCSMPPCRLLRECWLAGLLTATGPGSSG